MQRRAELQALKQQPAWAAALSGIVATQYASYRQGLLLSPWIAGEAVQEWDERRLLQLFASLSALLQLGFFDWDLCPGNLLDDGQIRLFDFGYMYRFDPLRACNSNGLLTPQCHAAERFETRSYYAYLLELEQRRGSAAALSALELEKRIALECYQHLRQTLAATSPKLAQLATLDAALDQMLGGREQRLLNNVPAFLKLRFTELRRQPLTAENNWLATFNTELEQTLLAELDHRLQPVAGMIEAISHEP